MSVSIPKNLPSLNNSQSQSQIKMGGGIIMQNWNTKPNFLKELQEYIKLPVFIDKNKMTNQSKLNKSQLPPLEKFKYNKKDE